MKRVQINLLHGQRIRPVLAVNNISSGPYLRGARFSPTELHFWSDKTRSSASLLLPPFYFPKGRALLKSLSLSPFQVAATPIIVFENPPTSKRSRPHNGFYEFVPRYLTAGQNFPSAKHGGCLNVCGRQLPGGNLQKHEKKWSLESTSSVVDMQFMRHQDFY